ncbi:hypothetical protein B0G81_6465 [Paraburkholderia sp. BL6665CI2N2]|uniref:hypothetical protein n=1 Tax=Paraburkholderia sp. BL6665CI2N2 TaxID=1938806 RepID=UPI0010662D3C|nr:hypothetical protein [Paraburkholderia sp. BL6665CI2N2]TDY25968.1 hypothetical protein B0G81_6465 [Paraburkholderia sp. BL6665CI2N2]
MKNDEHRLSLYRERLSRITVTSSSARGQPEGTIIAAQGFLIRIDLATLSELASPADFETVLERWTAALSGKLQSKSWGHARKFLNIFLYLCSRDFEIRKRYSLNRFDKLLEIPLDRHVAEGLMAFERCRKHGAMTKLNWTTIGALDQERNSAFQASASLLARQLRLHRAELDLKLWRRPKDRRKLCILCHG